MISTETYQTPLIPGPTSVPEYIRKAYLTDFGSADLEEKYFQLYIETEKNIQKLLNTQNKVAIMSGEGMVALWGALKSVVKSGDRVLAVSSGLFGDGFADMAKALGCETRLVKGPEGDSPSEDDIRKAAQEFKPKVITMVQCETPSGILNPVEPCSRVAKELNAIFIVDFVSCAGSAEVRVDDWNIDLGLLGTQKCLSCLPDLGIVTVSEKAWKVIQEVNYPGYDALLPFEHAVENRYFPYTPNWHAVSALNTSLKHLLEEGLENVFNRHSQVALHCREEIRKLGLKTYPAREELNAPSVTAIYMPEGFTWSQFNGELRKRGIFVGGTFGDLAGKIFRIGHMGSQANREIVDRAINAIREILHK
ncbi:serine-pyruvate aminotransferase/archaeal aspartate aminotransferase [Tritrichomonas foetus]|uniref:alanine--glyoxylate transaminase n=1 Tax=Tritrichomonas foetus TaxID=1144522 RepID=A0A1J4KCC2_9EUKA|nr:serine-pyruvate aminotransferase/archaeal aspartate aminotransferase [Tritrichomonas foetus]|eukprot:OHT07294.1 serine-pyruvate aminotransferase/archaeal aspartate aminotransferase [Tritrichomonas foetus]